MDKVIDLLRLMKQNYSTDIIYFERIIEKETSKPFEIVIENNQIKLFHKVTGTDKGVYTPSFDFVELANAFVEYNKPTLKLNQVDRIREVFSKYNINNKIW